MSAYQNLNQYFRSAGVQYENNFVPTSSGQSSAYPSGDGAYGSSASYDANQLASIAYPSAIDNTYTSKSSGAASNQQAAQQQLGYINYNESGQPASGSAYSNAYTDVVQNYAASTLYSANETPMGGMKYTGSSNKPVYQSRSTEWNRRYPTTNWRDRNRSSSSKPPQMFYCETCKISCAGPESFAEHQKGKKHIRMEKEKADAAKSGKPNPAAHVTINCVVCEVPCTGREAYEAHLKGSKHQRVISLLQRLGKPIPQLAPVPPPPEPEFKPPDTARIKVLGTPKINFHSGGRLHTTQVGGIIPPGGLAELMAEAVPAATKESGSGDAGHGTAPVDQEKVPQEQSVKVVKNEPEPVGESYVETVKVEGRADTYYCKLCDCNFNDDSSKQAHIRGRRHRLAYKKKVDPSLVVDIKPSDAKSRYVSEREKKQLRYNLERAAKSCPSPWSASNSSNAYGNKGGDKFMLRTAGYQFSQYPPRYDPYYGTPPEPYPGYMPPPQPAHEGVDIPPMAPHPYPPSAPMSMAPEPMPLSTSSFAPIPVSAYSQDDHLTVRKESELRPTEDETDDIYHLVIIVEKALKLVSDVLIDEDTKSLLDDVIAKQFNVDSDFSEDGEGQNDSSISELERAKAEILNKRALKGLQRVGQLADDTLITGEAVVDLVVICGEKPTRELLHRVGTKLSSALEEVAPTEPFEVILEPMDAAVTINSTVGRKLTVRVSFTSPLMRDPDFDSDVKEGQQLLNRQKCLESLASLRRTKWFQARVAHLHPAPIVIRVLRNMTVKSEAWSSLKLWPLQLLVERIVSSAGEPVTPGQALRHVFESIAGGIVLPGSPGILDPCEKEQIDALGYLGRQEREALTFSAQQALRMMAFRQLGKVLSVNLTPKQKRPLDEEMEYAEADPKVPKIDQE